MDWGPLPGQEHSIVRAEAFTLLKAFNCPCPCKVFCENAAVCANFRHLLSTPFLPHEWFDKQDYDVWCLILAQVAAKGPRWVTVQKTKAHRSIDTPNLSQEDIWEIKGNDKADRLAKKSLRSLISAQPAAWSVAVQQTKNYLKEIKNVWDLHQQASARVLEAKKATEDIHPENNTI